MNEPPRRRAARRRDEIDADVRRELNAGLRESANLVEGLAVDFALLFAAVAPALAAGAGIDPRTGITQRMARAAELILAHEGPEAYARLAIHPSDTVRGWAAYLVAVTPDLPLAERLSRIRPLALDPHFGVREWAWIALRPHVAAAISPAVTLLTPWVLEPDPYARRFAVEITRPRGVWCRHIAALKADPALGLPLLRPLVAEPVRYVQDSVANWLNDAAKSKPEWVRALCAEWLAGRSDAATRAICRRALRSIGQE